LRMWPPLFVFWRRAKRSCMIGDHQISAGDGMQLLLGSANRDPDEFPNPDEFIPDRHPNRHITFTTGIHRCIGSNFARMELRVALEEILRRFPDYTLREEEVCLPPNLAITFGYRTVGATFPPGQVLRSSV
jgi:cytochrome P450